MMMVGILIARLKVPANFMSIANSIIIVGIINSPGASHFGRYTRTLEFRLRRSDSAELSGAQG
jgi:hypothetical protein